MTSPRRVNLGPNLFYTFYVSYPQRPYVLIGVFLYPFRPNPTILSIPKAMKLALDKHSTLKFASICLFGCCQAPGEAEAQCAALVRAGKVYGTATEDMDALTFGSTVLLRHITFSAARKIPIQEFHLDKVLAGLELNQSEVRR